MARSVVRKVESLVSARNTLKSTQVSLFVAKKELEALHPENASLAQCLIKYMSVSLGVISQSFENVLQQVEHFHHIPRVSTEQVHPNLMLKDREVVSLVGYPCLLFPVCNVCKVCL